MLSLTVFIAALLIFIALFSQNIQTGLAYQQHSALSTKTSDLLDTILLNPGLPMDWGQSDTAPTVLGVQDPEFMQYKQSSYSTMRLCTGETSVYFQSKDAYYSNISVGYGGYLLAPSTKTVNYTEASRLLGLNGTYGFQFTLTPTINFEIAKVSSGTPLKLSVDAFGMGFPLANTTLSYSLILVHQAACCPYYTVTSGKTATDQAGFKQLEFAGVNSETDSYALLVYAYLNGLKGMGYYVHVPSTTTKSVVPLVDSFHDRNVLVAHSDAVGAGGAQFCSELRYNASFFILTEEYTLRTVTLTNANGSIGGPTEPSYKSVTVPNNEGILLVTYKDNSENYGVVLMPWGLGSLAFPLTIGGNPAGQNWVTTDIRQVTVGGIAYQAKLQLWSLQG